MATLGSNVHSRDISDKEVQKFEEALSNDEFRKLFFEYVKELSDEGFVCCQEGDGQVIQPEPNYVMKTTICQGSVIKKSFINMCSCSTIGKPSCVRVGVGKCDSGIQWSIPHSTSCPHDDLDKAGEGCLVCDVIFHHDTLKFAKCNRQFRRLVEEIALDAFQQQIHQSQWTVDTKNLKYPKLPCKGIPRPTYLRSNNLPKNSENVVNKQRKDIITETPKYNLKYRYYSDMQDYAINPGTPCETNPKEIVLEISLPKVHGSSEVKVDVKDRRLTLESVDGETYHLDVDLKYNVKEDEGNAKFDKEKKMLVVELPVIEKRLTKDEAMPDFTHHQDDTEIIFVVKVGNVISQSVRFVPEKTRTCALTFGADSRTKDPQRYKMAWRFPAESHLSLEVPRISVSAKNLVIAFKKMGNGGVCDSFEVGTGAGSFRWVQEGSLSDVEDKIRALQSENKAEAEPRGLEVAEMNEKVLSIRVKSLLTSVAEHEQSPNASLDSDVSSLMNIMASLDLSNGPGKRQMQNAGETIPPKSNRKVRCYSESSSDLQVGCFGSRSPKGILKCKRFGRSLSEGSDDVSWSSPEFAGPDSDILEGSGEEGGHSLEKKSVRFNDIVSRNIFKSNLSILSQRSKNQQRLRNRRRASGKRSSESDCSENESGESATRTEKCNTENQKMKAAKKRHGGKKSKDLDRYAGVRAGNGPAANRKGGSCSTSDGELSEASDNNNAETAVRKGSKWNKSPWKGNARRRKNAAGEGPTDNVDFANGLMFKLED